MALFSPHERAERVQAFAAKLTGLNAKQLVALRQELSRRMAKGHSPIGDTQGDLEALQLLMGKIAAAEQRTDLSPSELFERDSKRLAQEHGVGLKYAQNYITKHRTKSAPAPEEPEADKAHDAKNKNENAEELSRGRYQQH